MLGFIEHRYMRLDPLLIDIPPEVDQVGREYFARSPDSHMWVHSRELPEATRDALWKMHERELCFPAGLELSAERILECAQQRVGLIGAARMGLLAEIELARFLGLLSPDRLRALEKSLRRGGFG